jgi:hypothetical protein
MLPPAPSAELPVVENIGLDPDKTLVALIEGSVVGVASYIPCRKAGARPATWRSIRPGSESASASSCTARLAQMKAAGIAKVRSEVDRQERIDWYIRKFGYRISGKIPKRHDFCDPHIREWTVLTLEL